jgi:hypothetical protein
MSKYILVYEDNTKSVNFRFFECESEELIPFTVGESIWFDDICEDFEESEENEFLQKLDIQFESEETIIIKELPETFIKIEG